MARPPEIADDAIIAAGRSLAAESLRITGFALRKRLGAGAPNRLLRVWEKHIAEEAAAAAPEEPGLPVEEPLAEILTRFGRQTESLAGDIVALVTGLAR